MVDKIWYDWQNAHPENFWTYHGGTVQGIQNVSYYSEYPNGGPPFLTVRFLQRREYIEFQMTCIVLQVNSTMPADGLFEEMTIHNVMNTTGGFLCYVYE